MMLIKYYYYYRVPNSSHMLINNLARQTHDAICYDLTGPLKYTVVKFEFHEDQ